MLPTKGVCLVQQHEHIRTKFQNPIFESNPKMGTWVSFKYYTKIFFSFNSKNHKKLMSLPKNNHILRTPTKKTQTTKNPKRSEKPSVKIMKFQNLKLEKERQRNLRSKNEKAFRRNGEYLRHGELRTALRMSSNCLRDYLLHNGYEFASDQGHEFAL